MGRGSGEGVETTMRRVLLVSSTLVGLALAVPPPGASALAQGVSPGATLGATTPTYGPNPTSTKASNIEPGNATSPIAPQLPSTGLGPNATVAQYLGVARSALIARQTGLAQEALEDAETTALTRSVAYNAGGKPDASPLVGNIESALHALGSGDLVMAGHYTDIATQEAGK
jgi:hypothetical protein